MEALRGKQPSRKKALLIGGGAPNATLMAGALVAFIENKVEFDVVSTAGAGALLGLLYRAPIVGDARKALQHTTRLGIADAIYDWLPVNYKVFLKGGPTADVFREFLALNPFAAHIIGQGWNQGAEKILGDWLQLVWASLTPGDTSPFSQGLCAHVPFAEEVIDFAALPGAPGAFYINAFNVSRGKMSIWGKDEITPEHFRAALAFPFLYPPYRLGGEDYIEGAAIDTINFRALVAEKPDPDPDAAPPDTFLYRGEERTTGLHEDLDTLVVFDILGSEKLIRRPENLYDAWVRSIITPLVAIARDDVKLFERVHNIDPATHRAKRRVLKVKLLEGIAEGDWPDVLDWSASNLERLYAIGYRAGLRFCAEHPGALNL